MSTKSLRLDKHGDVSLKLPLREQRKSVSWEELSSVKQTYTQSIVLWLQSLESHSKKAESQLWQQLPQFRTLLATASWSEFKFTVWQQGTGTHGSRPCELREEKHCSHSRHWHWDGDEEEEEQSLRSTGTELGYSRGSLSRSSIQVKPEKEESGDRNTLHCQKLGVQSSEPLVYYCSKWYKFTNICRKLLPYRLQKQNWSDFR